MTPAERRELRRNIADAQRLSVHPSPVVRASAHRALAAGWRAEEEDPRPGFWLRLRLRLAGVRAG